MLQTLQYESQQISVCRVVTVHLTYIICQIRTTAVDDKIDSSQASSKILIIFVASISLWILLWTAVTSTAIFLTFSQLFHPRPGH